MRWAVLARPSGPAAYERWSRRMPCILVKPSGPPAHRGRVLLMSRVFRVAGAAASVRVGGVQRERRAGAHVRLAVPHELVVRRPAHQLGQLGLVGDEHRLDARRGPRCCPSSTSRGRGRPAPSRGGRTRRSRPRCTPCRPAARRCGTYAGSAAASRRRAWSRAGCAPAASASPCRAQPAPAGKSLRLGNTQALWPSTSWVRVLASPSSSFSTQSLLRTLRPGWNCQVSGVSCVDVRRHPLLVVLVGEVGAERAAADVGRGLVDALAALAEDAHVGRRQPGQVAAHHLFGIGRVDELDVRAGKHQVDFGHASTLRAG